MNVNAAARRVYSGNSVETEFLIRYYRGVRSLLRTPLRTLTIEVLGGQGTRSYKT